MWAVSVARPQRVEGYERFFGLHEPPFSLAPNPKFLFESASHAAALRQVTYALQRREPLVVITGEIGMGKTLLCRTVLDRMERKTFLSVVNDPLLARDDLLKQLLQDFGVISKDRTRLVETSRHDLMRTLQQFLASLIPLQAHAVVIVDEAQHLQPDVLEQIRLLSNIDDEHGTMLQIILVGQNDLEPILSRPDMRQFQQRVSRRFRLEPLNPEEVEQYIAHRLAVARRVAGPSAVPGATELERAMADWAEAKTEVTFSREAIDAIAKISGGTPRVINVMCDRALEAAYALRVRTIDLALVNTTARALNLTAPPVPSAAPAPVVAAAPRAEAGPPTRLMEPAPRVVAEGVSRLPEKDDYLAEFDAPDRPAPFGPGSAFEHIGPFRPVDGSEHGLPAAFNTASRFWSSTNRNYLLLAASLLVVAAVGWFGVPFMGNSTTDQAAPPAPAANRPSTSDRTPAATASPAAPDGVPTAGTAPPTPVSGSRPAELPSTPSTSPPALSGPDPARGAAPPPAGQRYEIVVASFRTETRTMSVANDVVALGLPMRRRTVNEWQQVLVGPFATRAQAEEAQQRLAQAGHTGTQITVR
jgi:type II secretory pathway predicted ATPase ExeA